jgi:hypothetical protein
MSTHRPASGLGEPRIFSLFEKSISEHSPERLIILIIASGPRIEEIVFVEGYDRLFHARLVQRDVFAAVEIQDPHSVVSQDFRFDNGLAVYYAIAVPELLLICSEFRQVCFRIF